MSLNDLSFLDEAKIADLKACLPVLANMKKMLEDNQPVEFWFGPEDETGISITPTDKEDKDLLFQMIDLLDAAYRRELNEYGVIV